MSEPESVGFLSWLFGVLSIIAGGLGLTSIAAWVSVRDQTIRNTDQIASLQTDVTDAERTLTETRDLARDTHRDVKGLGRQMSGIETTLNDFLRDK